MDFGENNMFGIENDQDPDRLAKYNRLPDKPNDENVLDRSDPEYQGQIEENDNSSSTVRRQEFKLTISDYEEIAQRYDESLKILSTVLDVLDTKENFKNMRERINRECEQMTLRIETQSLFKSTVSENSIMTNIYKIKISDIDKKGFLLLKTQKSKLKML